MTRADQSRQQPTQVKAPAHPEAGYALLFVYMMAACAAVMLYMELPRVAFEAQRNKEQLLIDRGLQYERGIQLYFRKFHQYPPTLDALDNTQNIRFIRHRYKDPMTGSEDWRLIHVGPGGVFTDSVLNKGKSVMPANSDKSTGVYSNTTPLNGPDATDPNQPINLATRRRPSDSPGAPGSPGGPPATDANGLPIDPGNPNAASGVMNAIPGQNVPGQPMPAQGAPGQIIQGANGSSIVLPDGRVVPAVNGLPGGNGQMSPNQTMPGGGATQQSPYGQYGQQTPYGTQQTPYSQYGQQTPSGQQPPYGQQNPYNQQNPAQQNPYAQQMTPGQPGAPPQAAVNLINQLLTTPRGSGLNGGTPAAPAQTVGQNSPFGSQTGTTTSGIGSSGTSSNSSFGATPGANNTGTPIGGTTGQTIGGGIAGVASKAEGEGIKIYNDRTKYKEWEFIYDLSKDLTKGGMMPNNQLNGAPSQYGTQAPGTPGAAATGAASPGSPIGTGATGTSSPFGANPNFGSTPQGVPASPTPPPPPTQQPQ